jgi:hypothetical protein
MLAQNHLLRWAATPKRAPETRALSRRKYREGCVRPSPSEDHRSSSLKKPHYPRALVSRQALLLEGCFPGSRRRFTREWPKCSNDTAAATVRIGNGS